MASRAGSSSSRRPIRTRLSEAARTSVQNANALLGRATGFAFARYPTRLNAELMLLLDGFTVNHVLDVGAHEGGFGRRLRAYTGFEGDITSFEPTPASYAVLEAAARSDPRWRTRNVALGSTDTTVALHRYAGDGQMNSIRVPRTSPTTGAATLTAEGDPVPVDVRRLDRVWPELHQDPSHTLLKTDTQGYDLEVIAGAGALLELIPAVLMEVAVQPIYQGAPTLPAVAAAMDGLGFEMTGAFPIHRYARRPGAVQDGTVGLWKQWDPKGLRVIEFDCTFVNRRSFGSPPRGGVGSTYANSPTAREI